MRLLIIPDIHNQTDNADYWLATQQYDRVIFLGDYFDCFGDDVTDVRRTAIWLRNRMQSPGDVFLLGNHDAAYMFPECDCPGFTRTKARGIREILGARHWERFRLAFEEQGWLFSHAGFHPALIGEPSVRAILQQSSDAMQKAKRRIIDPLLGAGVDRGGLQHCGGPLWLDWSSLLPIAGINQIVGHTPGDAVREKVAAGSRNYCLDVKNASVAAILTGGKLTILKREMSYA
jgi:hypothetical protein